MAEKVIITPSFKKGYQTLPQNIQKKVDKQIGFLIENPQHPSLQLHRLNENYWDFYVDHSYRGVCRRCDGKIELLFVGTHRLIDRW